jgi:putative ABC transport system permease protein
MAWWSRLANVFRSGAVERDLEAELQFHLEERIRERMAEGLTREAAAAEARRRFGSPLRWREQSRDVKLMPWIDSVGRDIRLGVRMLRKHAVVTAAAVVSLAMALGACVAAFSLVDALILRPLPVARPDRLVYLAFPTYSAERPEADTFNDPTLRRLRDASREQVDLFAMSTQVIRPVRFADGGGEKEPVRTQYVSGDAFDRLGIGPAAGRLISSEDDADPGTHPVAVVSHGFWTRRFAADPSIVGRWFTLEERAFQIVGIAEPGFTGIEPGRPTDLWMPYAMYNPRAFGNPQFNWFRVIGRLRENVPVEQAQAIAQTAFRNGRREQAPGIFGPSHSPANVERFLATPLYLRSAANGPSPLRREFERSLWILVSIAALVLLIAGSNVANLFLARTVAREREMALRLSIGADRRRLIQQLLIESAIVAGVASLLGLVFAAAAGPTVVGMLAPPEDPVRLDLRLNWRLIAVAGSLTVLTTALFGLAPALRASGVAPIAALKAGVRSGTRARVMRPFVAMQVAFGLVVLFVGGLLVLSFARLSSVNPGYATEDVLLLSLDQVRRVDEKEQRTALLQVLDRLRNVPRVQAVSSAEYNVVGRAWTHNIRMPGTQYDTIEVTMAPVTPGFFETMKIPVIAGRGLVEGDIESDTSTAVVVNESFATRYFGREPAVGRTLDARFALADGKHEVVGVVADTRYDLRKPAAPTVFIPLRLRSTGTVHVRVAGDAMALAARLREEVRAATPLFRVSSIRPQSAVVDQTLLRERLLALLSGFFAGVGLLLAAVGLYGVLSYSVVDRTREIGIRVALGARQLGVVRTVVADAGTAVLAGTACGLAGGLYLARFVETLLFEVRPLDFWSLALPLGTLLLAASVAAVLPALRAARVDPVIALRYE